MLSVVVKNLPLEWWVGICTSVAIHSYTGKLGSVKVVPNSRGGGLDGSRGLRACGQWIVVGRALALDSEDLGLGPGNAT